MEYFFPCLHNLIYTLGLLGELLKFIVLNLPLAKTKILEQKHIAMDLTRFYNNCVDRFATKV